MELILVYKGVAYVLCSIIAMIAAFTYKWATEEGSPEGWVGWKEYLFGDKKAIVKAAVILATSWGGITALEFLQNLEFQQVVVLAVTNGLAVPKKMVKERAKE